MRKKNNPPKREYAQPKRITTWADFLAHLQGLTGYASEWSKCGVTMSAAVNSNERHNPQTGFLEFLPDTPQWVIELADAMYPLGQFLKREESYQAGKAALAKHFDISFMP